MIRSAGPRMRQVLLCALWGVACAARGHHVGEALTLDQQLTISTNQFLGALAQWQQLPSSLKDSNLAGLVQLARTRQTTLLALVQTDPKVAAARLLPRSLRARIPDAARAWVEEEVRVQGSGRLDVADDFAQRRSRATLKLVGISGAVERSVYLADASSGGRDLHRLAGKRLTFTAMRIGEALLIVDRKQIDAQPLAAFGSTTATAGATAVATTSAAVQGEQKTLAILVNFTDKPLACTAADVSSTMFGTTGATVNGIYRESSRGLITFSGAAVGPYTIPYSSTGSCDASSWATAAEAAARAAGFDPTQYVRVSYITPQNPNCGWGGLAQLPGRQSWVQYCAATGVYAHELGHNLTLDHASDLIGEYGDYSDPMGGGKAVGHNAANRVMAGWQPGATVLEVGASGTYSVTSVSDSSVTVSPQVLRLAKADTAEWYYVSLREPLGVDAALDSSYLHALSVHRAMGTLPSRTTLLQVLAAGQSFTDPANGITVSNQGVGSGVATVGITFGAASCLRAVPDITLVPATQSGPGGATLAYTLTVRNNNTAACGAASFDLAQVLPAGWAGAFSATSVSLAPGSSTSVGWSVRSATGSPAGIFGIDARVTETGMSNNTSTAHGSYTVFADTAPTVTITTPASGAVLSGTKQGIAVAASDSAGIRSVEIYVDGALLVRDTTAPYAANWSLRKVSKGGHTISARAIDANGQASEQSIPVTVN